MSAPDMMPVSTPISTCRRCRPPRAHDSGSRWNGIGARSSWRPPWFESTMPSTPRVGELRGILDVLHALDDELARPHAADHVEVVERDRRVHRRVEQLADGAAGRRQRGELERRGGQEVPPPPRARDRVDDRAERELRRDREPVALVAQSGAGDRGVDGEVQGVEAGRRGPPGELVRDLAVAHHVELEPVAAVRVGRLDVLDRRWCRGSTA